MSIIKQTIYLARKTKEKDLEKNLYNLKNSILDLDGCLCFEVYKSDDCDDEFLVYEEWESEESYNESLNKKPFLTFMNKYDELVLRKESLPII